MREIRSLRAALIVSQVSAKRNYAERPVGTVVLAQLCSGRVVRVFRVRTCNQLLNALPESIIGVGRRRTVIDRFEAVFRVPLIGMGAGTCSVCRQIPCTVIAKTAVCYLVGRAVERIVRAGTVRLLIRNASHVSIAVVRKGQVMGCRACGRGSRQAIHVVITIRNSVAQSWICRVLKVVARLVSVIAGGGLRGSQATRRIRDS